MRLSDANASGVEIVKPDMFEKRGRVVTVRNRAGGAVGMSRQLVDPGMDDSGSRPRSRNAALRRADRHAVDLALDHLAAEFGVAPFQPFDEQHFIGAANNVMGLGLRVSIGTGEGHDRWQRRRCLVSVSRDHESCSDKEVSGCRT